MNVEERFCTNSIIRKLWPEKEWRSFVPAFSPIFEECHGLFLHIIVKEIGFVSKCFQPYKAKVPMRGLGAY